MKGSIESVLPAEGAILTLASVAALAVAGHAYGAKSGSRNDDTVSVNVGAYALELPPDQAERIEAAVSAFGLASKIPFLGPEQLYEVSREREAEARRDWIRSRTTASRNAHQVVVAHARSLRELADLMGMIKGTHSPYSREPSISPGDTISLSESASRPYYGMHPGSTWLLESVSGGTATLRRLRSDGRRLPQGKELRVKLKDLESLLQVHMDARPILKVERGVKETP
jgi:hypothetical protein